MNQTSVPISLNPAPIEKELFDDQVYQQLINKNILTSIDGNNCKLDIQKDLLESALQTLFDGEAGIDKDKSNEICNILKESYKLPSINIQETLDFSSIPEESYSRPFSPFNLTQISAVRIPCCGGDSTDLPVQPITQ
jgi:hypothetical protein